MVRKAILKVANAGNNLGQTMRRLDQNAAKDMESLIQQLKSLGLDNVVRKALRSQPANDDDTSTSSGSSNSRVPRRVSRKPRRHNGPRHDNPPPPAPSRRVLEARKRAERKQLAALRREEERKRQVKETLAKLRKEREIRQKALRAKKRAQQRNRMMAGNRYGHGGGGAGAARAARQRYKGPVRGGGHANQPRSQDEMLAIARERSKQLERERRNKLQEEARRNQEEAEKRLKARKLAEHKRQHYQGKQYDSNDKKAERRGVRDLDEWEIKQKAKQDLVAKRREREAIAFERRKKAEEERVAKLKAKWKDENDRMGRMLAEAKKKREERAIQDKLAKEAKAREDRDRKLAELKRQEEMAKAVKIAQAKREAAREQERRAAQMRDEGMQARKRLVQQQRRERSGKNREDHDRNRNEAWVTATEKEVVPVCPSSPLPHNPPRTDYSGMSAREKVLAKKKERQRVKDEEAQRRFDMARLEVQKDRKWAKHAAQHQRMSSEAIVKRTGMAEGTQQSMSKKFVTNEDSISEARVRENIADEAMNQHNDIALAAQMPGSKYSDDEDSIDRTVDESVDEIINNDVGGDADMTEDMILEEITSNTRLHEDHPIFQDSDDEDIFDAVDDNQKANGQINTSVEEVENDDNDDDDDDIYAEREEELEEELKLATMRCETLKQTLLKARQDQENRPSSHESKYSDDVDAIQEPYQRPIDTHGDVYEELDQGYDDTYSDSDDDDYSKNSNDSGAQDNVPPSDAQSGYLSQIEKRKKLLEERCMKKLGQVRFEAAFGVVLERYRRCERGEENTEDEESELEFTLAMSNLLGPDYVELAAYLEQLVIINEGYM